MKDTIYVVCMKLERINGEFHYDPCLDPTSQSNPSLLACDDLIALQTDNSDAIRMLAEMGDVIIVPVSLETYVKLDDELKALLTSVDTQINEAVSKMMEAYKLMNIDCDEKTLKNNMMAELADCGSSGKVLDSKLNIIDRTDDYILMGDNDGYEDEIEEDEEDEEDDEDDEDDPDEDEWDEDEWDAWDDENE